MDKTGLIFSPCTGHHSCKYELAFKEGVVFTMSEQEFPLVVATALQKVG